MRKKTIIKKAAATLSAAVLSISTFATLPTDRTALVADAAANTVIHNDTFWKDTSGKNIYSQGGGIFKFGDTYYWYGVHYKGAETYAADPSKKNNDYTFVSVSCYSSKDLVKWKFENDVLTPKSKGWNWAYWVGRMGVAYCPKSKKYVLVTQYNDSVLFAQCDSPTGNFEVKNVQDQITNVLKAGTGDQTVFVDDDGQAYIVCSNKGGRGHQYISKLRESDFLYAEPAKEVAKGSGREGNCLFKYKGKYYFCASDLHGWNSSHSYYMVADNINGPYSSWKVMDGTDEDFSYVTQTGFFVTVKGSKQETVLYCGDRWSDFAGNGIGYNQWVPLTVNGNNVKFNSLSEWSFNAQTGEWSVGAGNNYCLNPTFEADRVSQTTLAGWKASGTGNSNKKGGHTGNWCAQQYDANAYKATLTQDLNVPNGTYNLKAWVKSTGGQKSAMIYTRNSSGDKSVSLNKKMNNWTQVAINDIPVNDGKIQIGIYSDANAGNWLMVDDITLIRSDAPSEPITVEPEKIPDGKYIKSLTVNDSDNSSDWSIQTGIDSGKEVFGDRQCKFTAVPEQLRDAEWIRTACDSKKYSSEEASFKAGEDITAFVGVDTRAEANASSWLADWTKTDLTLTDDGNPNVTYNVYKKDIKNGAEVKLGAVNMNNAVNYVVMAKPYSADAVFTTTTSAETTTSAIAIETTTASVETATVSTETTTVTAALTATETAAETAPTTETTTTTAASRTPIYGDANCDGKVTVSDAVAILQYIGNRDKYTLTPEGADNADVFNRGDGITANDALAIQKLDAGIIDSLPES
ncbi:MAG: family 43 glycosylhydrolase [Ruminococcus sp.]|nr:family 43 glycosylhydrolase [Ruminococcus sp.]